MSRKRRRRQSLSLSQFESLSAPHTHPHRLTHPGSISFGSAFSSFLNCALLAWPGLDTFHPGLFDSASIKTTTTTTTTSIIDSLSFLLLLLAYTITIIAINTALSLCSVVSPALWPCRAHIPTQSNLTQHSCPCPVPPGVHPIQAAVQSNPTPTNLENPPDPVQVYLTVQALVCPKSTPFFTDRAAGRSPVQSSPVQSNLSKFMRQWRRSGGNADERKGKERKEKKKQGFFVVVVVVVICYCCCFHSLNDHHSKSSRSSSPLTGKKKNPAHYEEKKR